MDHFPEFPGSDELSPVDQFHALAKGTLFDSLDFDILDPDRPDVLTITAELGPYTLTAWSGPKTPKAAKSGLWCTIDGHTYAISTTDDDMGLKGVRFDGDDGEMLRSSVRHLFVLGATIEPFYQDQIAEARSAILNALDGIAENALDQRDEDEDEDDDREDWELALDAFTQQCRAGMFAGVSVDESPDVPGALNISAAVMDEVTHQPVKLKVFFRPSAAGEEAPDHWMAVGEIEVLAHAVDDENRAELLSGFPQESREMLLHLVDHLHAMAHAAAEVVIARSDVPYRFAQESGMPHDGEIADALTAMSSHAEADALAALNGVARLYTGTLPPNL